MIPILSGILRILVPVAVTWAVARGWISPEDSTGFTEAAIVVATTLVAGGLSAMALSPAGLVKKVAALDRSSVSETGKSIMLLDPNLQQAALEAATPPTKKE